MVSTELRIGNLIYGVSDRSETVIGMGNGMVFTEKAGYKFSSDLFDISPIPLSPDILLKAGAINKYGSVYFIGKLKFDENTIGLIRFHYSGKVVYLRYVHELQNLYWCLCSEELTLNL